MRKNVMYVCKENDSLAVLQFCFRGQVKVAHATSKEESLSELNTAGKIDLLLLEPDAPDMPLSEYLAFLEKNYPELPVIITMPSYSRSNNLIKELAPSAYKKVIDVIEGRLLNIEGLDKIFKVLNLKRVV